MKASYGAFYADAHRGTRQVNAYYSYKRLRHSWLVYETHTGNMYDTYPTREIAYYVAARLNGSRKEESKALVAKVFGE